ncbi:MAG: hypothetical protein L0216_19225 [Planctomycetales bacterium]|nr:hypothetical protein [Planctomycetales bacterium]
MRADTEEESRQGPDTAREARRRLLQLALYLPPAVLGTFAVTRSAGAHTCAPSPGCRPRDRRHCLPCTPHGGPGCTPPCAP